MLTVRSDYAAAIQWRITRTFANLITAMMPPVALMFVTYHILHCRALPSYAASCIPIRPNQQNLPNIFAKRRCCRRRDIEIRWHQ
jgi:hypothetical protein